MPVNRNNSDIVILVCLGLVGFDLLQETVADFLGITTIQGGNEF